MPELIGDSEGLLAAAGRGLAVSWWARLAPDRPALLSPEGDRSFAELDARANQLARALRRHGLIAGDAVALMCGNRPEFVEVWAACQRTGLRLTPINWHLTGDEAAYIVANCEAKVLIAEAALGEAASRAAAASGLTARFAIGGERSLAPSLVASGVVGFENYDEALISESTDEIEQPSLGTVMLYTSGTTGRPKGVRRPPVSEITSGLYKAYGYCHGDVHLCTGPLYHAAPLGISMAVPVSCGVTVALMPRWDAAESLRRIERDRVTHTHMVPTMFHRLLALPADERARDLSSLKAVVHGAAPCPRHVKQAMIEWLGPILFEYYAATEGAGTVVDSHTWLRKPGTVGKPMPAGQVIVGDQDAQPLPADEVGLVWLQAPAASRFDYFKDEGKTNDSYRGAYFTLGDLGYLDADGYLFLTDRSANLIISGGVNIYTAEIDAVLLQHAAVADAATIGVPNEEWGEEVKAVIELRPGYAAGAELADELMALCRAQLAHFKCPRSIDFIAELPRQDNGKIYKRLLRDRYR